ncbi:hypothetical protein QJS24_gp57 [Serratia phage vB_SmaS_Rovert]|uniref:Uncharacterized protein n=1 Tax=Serratia phage vB_SmaS_Rovert TaxID=2777363 RepID=A0A7T3TL22_9CAUD|nr:hypothetical protein QJS24_gp57 [Serratia phage vB_SmaS_Rovert]QPX75024.1 hypothetical protein [Serratia phage vB_SmaS_Rovert]
MKPLKTWCSAVMTMRKKIVAILISEHYRKLREWRAVTKARIAVTITGMINGLPRAEVKAIAADLVDLVKPNAYISDQNIIDLIEAWIHGDIKATTGG